VIIKIDLSTLQATSPPYEEVEILALAATADVEVIVTLFSLGESVTAVFHQSVGLL